jgi:hypothetical protein
MMPIAVPARCSAAATAAKCVAAAAFQGRHKIRFTEVEVLVSPLFHEDDQIF